MIWHNRNFAKLNAMLPLLYSVEIEFKVLLRWKAKSDIMVIKRWWGGKLNKRVLLLIVRCGKLNDRFLLSIVEYKWREILMDVLRILV